VVGWLGGWVVGGHTGDDNDGAAAS